MESMAQYPRLFRHLKVNYFELRKTSSNFSNEGKDESDTNYHKLMFCCGSELRGKSIYADWFNEKYRQLLFVYRRPSYVIKNAQTYSNPRVRACIFHS